MMRNRMGNLEQLPRNFLPKSFFFLSILLRGWWKLISSSTKRLHLNPNHLHSERREPQAPYVWCNSSHHLEKTIFIDFSSCVYISLLANLYITWNCCHNFLPMSLIWDRDWGLGGQKVNLIYKYACALASCGLCPSSPRCRLTFRNRRTLWRGLKVGHGKQIQSLTKRNRLYL